MTRIAVELCVYNGAQYLSQCLRSIYDFADQIVICEGNWNANKLPDRSTDGTIQIIDKFLAESDPAKKITHFHVGKDHPEHVHRSEGLRRTQADWLFVVDCDEIYKPDHLANLRKIIEQDTQNYTFRLESFVFYFDFSMGLIEDATVAYRLVDGCHFYDRRELVAGNGTPYNQLPQRRLSGANGIRLYHYAYVPQERVEEKMKLELYEGSKEWYENIYLQFDPNSPEKVYQTNRGGVHLGGGGRIVDFKDTHPTVMESHPLYDFRWNAPMKT